MTLSTPTIQAPRINRRPKQRHNLYNFGAPNLEKSVIKTLAYYEALGQYPLTAIELWRYLQKENDEQSRPSFYRFLKALEQVDGTGQKIQRLNGFRFLTGKEKYYTQRISRQKIASAKWKKVRRIGVWLAACPFLRGLVVSGSLAFDNTKEQSDIDFLVITAPGRIWTGRTFLSFLLQIIGQRRHGDVIENKICLNHYIALDTLTVPLQNLSNAHLYSHLIPLTDYQSFALFQEQNAWIADFIFSYPQNKENNQRIIGQDSVKYKIWRALAKITEFLLGGFLGNILEKRLAAWQTKRIHEKTNWRALKDEQLHLGQGALLFHYPICKNEEVMNKYKQKVKMLKLA
jgi:predicted nucleotidyltransferase